MDQEKIQAFRDAQAQQAKEKADALAAEERTKSVTGSVAAGSLLGAKASTEIKQTVKASGDKVASEVEKVQGILESGQDSVAQAINNLMLATVLTKDPRLAEAADNVAKLLSSIADAGDKFGKSNLNLLPVANKELASTISDLAKSVGSKQDKDLTPEFDRVVEALNSLDVQPVVNVPESKVQVDTKPIVDAVKELQKSIKPTKIDIPKTDFSDVIKGLGSVQKAITGLTFPVANYVLPFKDINGRAVQVQLDSSGNVPTSGGSGGSGDGTIVDGVNAAIKATVLDYVSSNPLAVRLTDTAGDYVTAGGGTQYTEGDTDSSITGTAMLWEDTSDTLRAVSAGKGLPISGGYLDVTGSAGSLNADVIASTNVSQYKTVVLQVTGTWVGTITFQASNDNSNFVTTLTTQLGSSSNHSGTISSNEVRIGTLGFKYFRARMTAYTSGTADGTAIFSAAPADVIINQQTVTQSTASNLNAQVVGNVASAATDSGNPIKVGGIYNSTQPTLTNGQRGDIQLDSRGSTRAVIFGKDDSSGVAAGSSGDAGSNGTVRLWTSADLRLFNGTTWDRARGDTVGLMTKGNFTEQASLTAGSLNADLVASTDVSGYKSFSIQILGTWSGTLTFQGSNDNSNFSSIPVTSSSNVASQHVTTTTANAMFWGSIQYRYLRVRMTSYSSGTATGTLELYTYPMAYQTMGVAAAQNGGWTVDTELTAVAALADATANPTITNIATFEHRWNGSTWDRVRSVTSSMNNAGTGVDAMVANFDDASPTAITENSFGAVRMSANRNVYTTIRDAAGNERGLNIDAAGQISVKLTDGTDTADVLDLSNSNPLTVALVDTNGDQISSFGGGTQYTEDAAAAANPVGTALNLVRADALAGLTTTDGDNVAARGTDKGEQYVKHADSIAVTSATFATAAKQDTGNTSVGNIDTTTAALSKAEDAAHSSGDKGIMALSVRQDTAAALAGTDADYQPLITDASGRLHVNVGNTVTVASHAVTNAGTFAVQATEADGANVTLGAKADAKSTATDTTAITVMQVLKQISASVQAPPSQAVTNTGTFATQSVAAGDTAHDAVDAGNPVKIGFTAETSPKGITTVADGDRTTGYADADGLQMVKLYTSNADMITERIADTAGTSAAFANFTAVASTRNYVTSISVYNSSTTDGYVDIRDGTAGTILHTIAAPALGGATEGFSVPLRQTTTNTALAYDVSGAITTVYISLVGFQSKL